MLQEKKIDLIFKAVTEDAGFFFNDESSDIIRKLSQES